jgi:uncharacterized protein (TIGR02246 family)
MRIAAFSIFILLAFVACETEPVVTDTAPAPERAATEPAPDRDADGGEVERIRSQWLEAAERNDAAAVAALYSDDAIVTSPMGEAVRGRESIRELWTEQLPMSSDLDIDSSDFEVSGDLAYDYGTFSQTLTTPAGEEMEVEGEYVVILRRQDDGQWRITRHLSFNRMPDGAPGTTPQR